MSNSSEKQPARHRGVWRIPHAESEDYPGLVVHDGRVTGSITAGHSRLPLWALIATAVTEDWQAVQENWPTVIEYEWDEVRLAEFLYCLMEQRGEFGRLICMLADVERREMELLEQEDEAGSTGMSPAWWQMPEQRQRVIDQLRLCLQALESNM